MTEGEVCLDDAESGQNGAPRVVRQPKATPLWAETQS